MRTVFDVASLAEHWACGTDTVYALIKSGDLQAFKLGGKLLRIRAEEVERYECRTDTASNDCEAASSSSITSMVDAEGLRLARTISRQPKPSPASTGEGAAGRAR